MVVTWTDITSSILWAALAVLVLLLVLAIAARVIRGRRAEFRGAEPGVAREERPRE